MTQSPPPHSIDAEQSVLGGLLLDDRAFDLIAEQVSDVDFYRDDHRRIFRNITRLYLAGKPVDAVTVAEALERSGESNKTGGLAYLGELAANTPSAANIRRYAEIVRERACLRRIQEAALNLHAACSNTAGRSLHEIIGEAETALQAAIDRTEGDPKPLTEVFQEVANYVDSRSQSSGASAGLETGFCDLDRMIGGLEPGNLAIIAARPSCGKTMFSGNIADHTAQTGRSVLFFTLEMSAREIGMRLMAARARLSVQTMRAGTDDVESWGRMSNELGRSGNQKLFICDKGAIGVGFVRAKARQIKRKHGLDLIVIDYLQLMTAPGHSNRTQEIGNISRNLKALAKELQVPIIALAQLNRGVESRPDKRPMMSDLRDSGEVEQDADIVIMLHRESLYNDAPEWQGIAEALVRKNRNGALGDITLSYHPEAMRFANYAGQNPRQSIGSARYSSRDAIRHQNRSRGIGDE